ncbi:MAG: hypothetical protein JW946_06250 [Candidatus Omnitrophica bacterium]|nr:hypothetical protein [Candidatus Omnitrophota bacterium]
MAEEKPAATPQPAQSTPAQQPAAPAQQPAAAAAKKNKKINEMTLAELDKKIEDVKVKMGNLTSKYALELLKRKKEITGTN